MSDIQELPPPLSLRAKMLNVMAKVGYVQKRGTNKHFNYKYATEADVAEKVRAALIEERVLFVPSVTSISQRGNVTDVMLHCRLYDVDGPDYLAWDMAGSGQDPGDKGPYKAVTGAEKYALMKLLLIATGDDPEGDEKTDKAGETGPPEPVKEVVPVVSTDQWANLGVLLADTATDPKEFCEFFSIKNVADLPASEYKRAVRLLEKKKEVAKKARERDAAGK